MSKTAEQPGPDIKTHHLIGAAMLCSAAAYRSAFFSLGGMGCWAVGIEYGIGCFLAYPMFVLYMGPPVDALGAALFKYSYAVVAGMTVVHWAVSKAPSNRRHPYDIGRPMLGGVGEWLLAGAVALYALPHCPGISMAVGLGLVSSNIQEEMIQWRYKRQAKHVARQRYDAEVLQQSIEDEMGN